MKNYTITVNGNVYEVSVEENDGAQVQAVQPKKTIAKPAAAKPAAKPAQATGAAGSVKVNAPMPGKVLSIKANAGQAVKKGDVLMILEAMKMENEIVAPQDGTVASINATAGSMVEAGEVLATLN